MWTAQGEKRGKCSIFAHIFDAILPIRRDEESWYDVRHIRQEW